MPQEFKEQIINEIVSTSNGMFLLPALQIEAVLEKPTVRKRKEALKQMPRGLSDAFKVTLDRIRCQNPDMAQQAMDILQWTFLAQRGLKLEELRHALAVEPEDTDLDWENFIDAEGLLDCCLGLVIIDDSTSTVRLVHKSLQDYLKTEYEQNHIFEHGHYKISPTIDYMLDRALNMRMYRRFVLVMLFSNTLRIVGVFMHDI
ncbi:Similar to ankyrin repeat-containing protein, putative [Penicillium marneffei ATCC 18224]; acc. no. XP_002144344 [Pyronema omphalodes CBS 100304]|uniref:Similar to ankyrin repeat-containing protein, putative [Penicillium marneffei ATCC 18224] acc. no. XP_002144344 n=1 Tax=Pyronema omphalodes (strain CBS 100304) TaxID=1076935 RepID=U4LF71_PYROM|nr:Similar to ankyrin repeat-containing protein, putative [Penicillium marneffei ATCC 18224]; acc. no. XP_002144344 [Pyronema omphalodes CBS 100304]